MMNPLVRYQRYWNGEGTEHKDQDRSNGRPPHSKIILHGAGGFESGNINPNQHQISVSFINGAVLHSKHRGIGFGSIIISVQEDAVVDSDQL